MSKVLPRGPKGHFLLGSGPDLARDQLGFYAACAREYGDVVPVRLGLAAGLLIYHPDAIEEVLVTRSRDFIKSPGVRLLRATAGRRPLPLRGRRLAAPAAARPAGLPPAARRGVRRGHDRVYGAAGWRSWQDGDVLDVHAEMMALTQAIVAKTLFDADVSDEATPSPATSNAADGGLRRAPREPPSLLPGWVPTPANLRTSARAIRRLDEVVYRMIAARRQSDEDRGDLLSMLLQAQDADDGSRMTDRQVRDEVMTLFLAGHETTAVALSWTWYLLAQHPEVDARLAEELPAVLGDRAPRPWPTCRGCRTPRCGDRDHAALPAGVRDGTAGRRSRPRWPATRWRRAHRHHAHVGGAPRPALVRGARGVPPGALGRRAGPPSAALRVLPLRRRATPVHRQRVRA